MEAFFLAISVAADAAGQAVHTVAPVVNGVSSTEFWSVVSGVAAFWLGPKGIAFWLSQKRKNGNGGSAPSKIMIDEGRCDRRHEAESELRKLENAGLTRSLDKLDGSVTRLHERLDEFLKRP